jgi:hypothetical protein
MQLKITAEEILMDEAESTSNKKTAKKNTSARKGSAKSEESSNEEKKPSAKKSAAKSKEAVSSPDETTEPKKVKAAAAAAAATPPAPAETPKEEQQAAEEATGEADSEPKEADATDNSLLPATKGKVGIFGGPKDRSIKPDDKLELPIGRHFTYERARSLNWKSFYCAMRWNYRLSHMSPEEGKRWWANKKLTVTNPATGQSVVVRAVDYGPHEKSGLDILISPGAAEAIGVEAGNEVEIGFADQKAPLGPVGS